MWRSIGNDSAWTDEAHLIAFAADVAQISNWQRGGGKGSKPKPLARPGDDMRANLKRARIEARARAFRARQSQVDQQPAPRPRDARGRFVKREG